MKKVLLVNCNRCVDPYPVFPLGLSYLYNALVEKGFCVRLIDILYEEDVIISTVKDFAPDFIGLSLRNIDDVKIDDTRYFVPDLLKIKELISSISAAPVIIGGSGFSLFPVEIMNITGADFGLSGEAENSFPALLEILSNPYSLQGDMMLAAIPGLIFRKDINVIRTEQKRDVYVQNYKTKIAHSIFSKYIESSSMVNVQTQRGCPFSCCYCSYPVIEGNHVRYRDAEAVVDEIIQAVSFGARYFFIVDSVFNISNDHVVSICEELIRRDVRIAWGCFLRPSNLNRNLMHLMARAGLKHIEFGSDSFCDEILLKYNKKFTFEEILQSSELARAEQIYYAHFLITGGPGEREDTLRKAFQNSLLLKKTVIFPFVGMRIFPQTELYKIAIDQRIITGADNLLQPSFYVSSYLCKEHIRALLNEFHRQSPRWIVNEPDVVQQSVMNGLRKKGICGPLWEFLTS